jgi:hypothetical protein
MIREDFLKPSNCWCRKAYGWKTTKITRSSLSKPQVADEKVIPSRPAHYLTCVKKQCVIKSTHTNRLTGNLLNKQLAVETLKQIMARA